MFQLEYPSFKNLFLSGRSVSIDKLILRNRLSQQISGLLGSPDFEFRSHIAPKQFEEFATKVEEITGEPIRTTSSFLEGSFKENLTNWSSKFKDDDGYRFPFILACWYSLHYLKLNDYADPVDRAVLGASLSNVLEECNSFEEITYWVKTTKLIQPAKVRSSRIVDLGPIKIALENQKGLTKLSFDDCVNRPLIEDGKPNIFSALNWRSQLTKLYGKTNVVNQLLQWALEENSKRVEVMLLTGPGGSGKSKIAGYVIQKLASEFGWSSGFPLLNYPTQNLVFDGSGAGVVIAIDYPEENLAFVKEVLDATISLTDFTKPIRIILVSRENKNTWLNHLNRRVMQNLQQINLIDEQYLSYNLAIRLAEDIFRKYKQIQIFEENKKRMQAWFNREPSNLLPLNIVAVCIHALYDNTHSFDLKNEDILRELVHIELKRTRDFSSNSLGNSNKNILELLLCLSIFTARGLNKETIYELASKGLCTGLSADSTLKAVFSTPYWGGGGKDSESPSSLSRIQPDKLAAAFVIEIFALSGDWSPSIPEFLSITAKNTGETFTLMLARVLFDVSQINTQKSSVLEELSIAMLQFPDTLVAYDAHYNAVGHPKIVEKFNKKLLELLMIDLKGTEAYHLFEIRAANFNAINGEFNKAFILFESGISALERLHIKSPGIHGKALINAYYEYGHALTYVGEFKIAETVASKSLALLTDEFIGSFDIADQSILASELSKCAEIMRLASNPQKAILLTEKAIGIFRNIRKNHPNLYSWELIECLTFLDTAISDEASSAYQEKYSEKGILALEEAIELLITEFSDFGFDYMITMALSLRNLSNRKFDTDKFEAALELVDEVLVIYSKLESQKRDFDFGLEYLKEEIGISLTVKANILNSLGRYEEALTIAKQSLKILKKIISVEKSEDAQTLMDVNQILSNIYANQDRLQRALCYNRKSIQIAEKYWAMGSDLFDSYYFKHRTRQVTLFYRQRRLCLGLVSGYRLFKLMFPSYLAIPLSIGLFGRNLFMEFISSSKSRGLE